jgi:beta-alanine degradation protein BauB
MPMTTRLTSNTAILAAPDWSGDIRAELQRNRENGRVGHVLLSETDAVRIWRIALRPGERIGFHRHQLDYFWVAVTGGTSLSRHATGVTRQTLYAPGDVRHIHFARGEFMLHDLTNSGDTELLFTTVEFKVSANPPLPI